MCAISTLDAEIFLKSKKDYQITPDNDAQKYSFYIRREDTVQEKLLQRL